MLYKACVSFSGKITMTKGKVGEIADSALVDDLLKAGYIIPHEADKKAEKTEEEKPKSRRKGKTE